MEQTFDVVTLRKSLYAELRRYIRANSFLSEYRVQSVPTRGITTVDVGQVYDGNVYKVKVFESTNASFWMFSDEYEYYRELPTITGITWVTPAEKRLRLSAMKRRIETLRKLLQAQS